VNIVGMFLESFSKKPTAGNKKSGKIIFIVF
jgi:hypothetical protein